MLPQSINAKLLNKVIHEEQALVESYDTVLKDSDSPLEKQNLSTMMEWHRQSLSLLKNYLRLHGNTPQEEGEGIKSFNQLMTSTARLMSNKMALKSLINYEEKDLELYRKIMLDDSIDSALKMEVKDKIIPRIEKNIEDLKELQGIEQ